MLVEFSVENYRSIKERQTLSMVTSETSNDNNRCVLNTGFNSAPVLLESTAIYGPNGAGKSNLIAALEFFQEFVIESAKGQEGDEIPVAPFLFSEKTQKEPSTFEIVFVHEDFLFQYGFTADKEKVYDEWLYATPKGKQKQKTQAWFERNKKEPINKNVITGDRAVWLRATRENALFLSTAVQLNSEDFKKPFDWIRSRLRVLPRPEILSPSYTFRQIHENDKKDFVLRFMKGLDASFDDIVIEEKEFTEHDLPKEMPDEIKQLFFKDTKNKKRFEVHTVHKIEEGGHYQLPLNEELAGTKRLLAFAGPILDVFEKGCALVVDEIHNSLHPLALKGIISLFHDKEINKKNAQLIFTTHDTNTMNYLERDQIWLLDKGKFGNTTFTALSEFKGKADEPIEKRYLGGRYGALPNIKGII